MFVALLLAAAAPPAEPPMMPLIIVPSSTADPATLAAADRLLTAMDYDRMMSRSVDSMIAQSGPVMKKQIEARIDAEVPNELIARIQGVQSRFLRERLVDDANLRRAIALLYAKHFSAAELDRLTVLYADPVMRKWTEVAPALMGDMMPLMLGIMDAHKAGLEKDIIRVVEEYAAEQAPAGS